MKNKFRPFDLEMPTLAQMKDRLIELFFEYMRIAIIVIFFAIALGMLMKVGNNLLGLEATVLKMQLEFCRMEQNIDMVGEAMENRARFRADGEASQRTFDRQMRALDRIDKSIGDTTVKLEELKDDS